MCATTSQKRMLICVIAKLRNLPVVVISDPYHELAIRNGEESRSVLSLLSVFMAASVNCQGTIGPIFDSQKVI